MSDRLIRFECDYGEGAVPEIIRRLSDTNFEQTCGYGEDAHCAHARELILSRLGGADADVHFLVGGTQTNMILLTAALRPHQGALSANTGHINVHESGAIEATGHKVLSLPSADGKITAAQVKEYCDAHWADVTHEHTVQPALVYISFPTENGLLYSLEELTELSRVCRENGLFLYADGARMGYALASEKNDVTLADLARLTDAFYIGGTKVGALFGEALVIMHPALRRDFRYILKQRGGMLAKGRLLGIQFEALFEDGLYDRISVHADKLAMRVRRALEEKGIPLWSDSYTNQQFPILPDDALKRLDDRFAYSVWTRIDGSHTAVRFATSWATREEDVDTLIAAIRAL